MLKKLSHQDITVEIPEHFFKTKPAHQKNSEFFIFQPKALEQIRLALEHPDFFPHFVITGMDGLGKMSGILSLLQKEYSAKRLKEKLYLDRMSKKVVPESLVSEEVLNAETLFEPLFDIHCKGTPIVYDPNPSIMSLVGIPSKDSYHPGSLVKAFGGFLILPLTRMTSEPAVFDVLRSCLITEGIDFMNLPELLFFQKYDRTLPRLPISTRVILVGEEHHFDQLIKKDSTVIELFKMRADLEYEAVLNEKNAGKFSFLIDSWGRESFPKFDSSAKKRLAEESLIQNESKTKISLNLADLKFVYDEAVVLGVRKKAKLIKAADVDAAIKNLDFRFTQIKRKYYEDLKDGIYNLTVKGKRLGRINGLSVFSPYSSSQEYGQVNVISARAVMGTGNIINVEREVNLSGDSHDKGVFILQSFLKGMFANFASLGADISIVFEQNHSIIDGDSASTAELMAVISALSGVEIPANIALTGSISQYGDILAVGAVALKLEGWFDISRILGSSKDSYKVFIPETNSKDLVLKPEIREAVKKGKFNIFTFSHVSDIIPEVFGMELGRKEKDSKYTKGSLLRLIEDKLEKKTKEGE